MSIKVGINGFGRIGRLVLRCAKNMPNIEIVGKKKNQFNFSRLSDFSLSLSLCVSVLISN